MDGAVTEVALRLTKQQGERKTKLKLVVTNRKQKECTSKGKVQR